MWRKMRELRQEELEPGFRAGGRPRLESVAGGAAREVDNMVHALRPSLASIDMAAQLLVMDGLSAQQRGEMCEQILGQCQKMKALLAVYRGRESAS